MPDDPAMSTMTHPRWDPVVVERVARAILTVAYPDITWDSDLDHDDRVYMRRLAGAALDTLDEMGCLTQIDPAGRDCPACPHPRGQHSGWGCDHCHCRVSIVDITPIPLWEVPR